MHKPDYLLPFCVTPPLQKALASCCHILSSLPEFLEGFSSAHQHFREQLFSVVLSFVMDEKSVTSVPGADKALVMIEVWGLKQTNELQVLDS